MLHLQRHLYSLYKIRRHLLRHCKRCEKRFGLSNYELHRLPKEENKEAIGLMKGELVFKIMTDFTALIPKTYLANDSYKNKKAKSTEKFVIKRKFKFGYYKHC